MEENKIEGMEKELVSDTLGKVSFGDSEVIRIRKDKIIKFLKAKYDWIVYIILAFIVLIAVKIRTRNLDKLRDVTTGTWTLGPDLDPFLFLRWAEYIVEHGKLYAIDTMRYVPLGFKTTGELLLHPYMMAWFHKIAVFFGSESVTHSAVLYPVFMFALTVIAFFLFAREASISMGKTKSNIIALIASLFLSIVPALLPRTIAGIPEKESAAFLFMFLAFYFFLYAWRSESFSLRIISAVLAGLFTGSMALIWGGYSYVFLTLMVSVFVAFLAGGVDKNKFLTYMAWIFSSLLFMWSFSPRYPIVSLLSRGISVVAFILIFHFVIWETKLKRYFESEKMSKMPRTFISICVSILILAIIASVAFGPGYLINRVSSNVHEIINPGSTRFVQTVAENKSPFFKEWIGSFGPFVKNIPVFFWLFFIGSIYMFYNILSMLAKKERFYLTAAYIFLLSAICFNKYASDSRLNGTNNLSLAFYAFGLIIFVGSCCFYYYKYHKKKEMDKLKGIDMGLVTTLALFLLTLVSLRGGIRLVMVLTPSISIVVAYLAVGSVSYAMKKKNETTKIFAFAIAALVVIATVFSGWQFYKQVNEEAAFYGPSGYTQQWQRAMAWVRENTPQSAVFGHWWDYGYWLQSIGKRATMLDGGNSQGYWNHMMGRYGLTGTNKRESLEFLYAHNVTHFLIDSTDIGKYAAYSSIGSDANHDRLSWINVFARDNNQVRETKNGSVLVFSGGTSLDEDIIYKENETQIFIPRGSGGLGAIIVELDSDGKIIQRPIGIYVYQNNQYPIPLRYAFSRGEFYDFGSGLEAGLFLMPRAIQSEQGLNIERDGALLYLSKRTVKSQLARLYLYKENDPNFKLVHNEDDALVSFIKSQNSDIEDIIFFDGVRGPIRIWELNYPTDIELNEKYLETKYPEELEGII